MRDDRMMSSNIVVGSSQDLNTTAFPRVRKTNADHTDYGNRVVAS